MCCLSECYVYHLHMLITDLIVDGPSELTINALLCNFPAFLKPDGITLCCKAGHIFRLICLVFCRVKGFNSGKHGAVLVRSRTHQLIIKELLVMTGAPVPVRYCLFFSVLLYGSFYSVLCTIGRIRLCIKCPIGKINPFKMLGLLHFPWQASDKMNFFLIHF